MNRLERHDESLMASLDSLFEQRAGWLALVLVSPDSSVADRKQAHYELAVVPMAQQALAGEKVPHNPQQPAAWMAYAGERLVDFVAADPANREVLLETVFCDDTDPHWQRRFAVSVSAAVVPQGEYDAVGFAQGVIDGTVAPITRR